MMLNETSGGRSVTNWRPDEVQFLQDHVGTMPMRSIAEHIGRTERAVSLYCYRHRIATRKTCVNPIMPAMLRVKFGDPAFFTPTRDFFVRTGISQKRWSVLSRGYCQPTEEEMRAVARVLNYSVDEALQLMECRQLDLFDDHGKDGSARH